MILPLIFTFVCIYIAQKSLKKYTQVPLDFYQGKVVWVTGASSGIGKELALLLARNNANIILSSRNERSLEIVQKECQSLYPKNSCCSGTTLIIPLDLSACKDLEYSREKVQQAVNHFGHIDVMIHNAGVSSRGTVLETRMQVYSQMMDVNFLGTVGLTKALLPEFLKNNRGSFVVISSLQGKLGLAARSSYAACKHSLHGFFDSLRVELSATPLQVSLICPAYVKTNLSLNALTGAGGYYGKMDATTLRGMDASLVAAEVLCACANGVPELILSKITYKIAANFIRPLFPSFMFRILNWVTKKEDLIDAAKINQ